MTALHHHDEHPAARAARVVDDELASVADVALWSMPPAEAAEVLVTLTRVRSRLDAFLVRVLRHAEVVGVGSDCGARSAAAWWAHETRVTRAEAARLARLGMALEDHGDVASALGAGEVRTDQARVVVDAVDALPDDLPKGVGAAAEQWLLAAAGEHDARALRVLGRRVLEVVDPTAADAEEARRLESEEEDARAAASFTMVDDGHGRCHGRFTIPSLHGAMLRKQLLALAAPGRQPADAGGGRTLSRHRMGLAFMEYVESRPGDSVPSAGGVSATVVVTLDLDTLMGGLRAASLDTGSGSAQGRPDVWPAGRGSSPSFSAARQSSSTWVAGDGCTPSPNASPSVCVTAAARQRAATSLRASATPTTTCRGAGEEAPASPTVGCCVPGTTGSSTIPPSSTPSTSTGRCASVGGREEDLHRSLTRSPFLRTTPCRHAGLVPAARPRTTRPRSPRPRRRRPWRTALAVVAVTATLGACGPVGAGPPGARADGVGADGADPDSPMRTPPAASDALQERADDVFESFAGTARQREAGGLLRAWALNGGMDTCLAAEGFPEWDWSAAHAAEPPTDALGTSVWFAAPLSHRYSDGLRATVLFLEQEEALRSAEPSAREDAAIGRCLSTAHPAADSEVERVSVPPEARRLSEKWWAMLAGWDTSYGQDQVYEGCFLEQVGDVVDLPEGIGSWRAELTRHAPRVDDVPVPGTDEAEYPTSWRDFTALEATVEEADWACRADVYTAHLDEVARDVEAFAREHATEIDAAARGWDDVVAAAAGLPDPLAGS